MLIKAIKNTAWLSLDQILRLATSFFIGAWVARYLSPQQYGLLNYSIAFVESFAPFAYLNVLNQIVIRDLAAKPESKDEILGTTFILKVVGSLVTIPLAIGIIFSLQPNNQLLQLSVSILSINSLFGAFTTVDCWFQYQIQSKYTVIAKNLTTFISIAVKISLIYLHAPLVAFVAVFTLESVLGALALVVIYRISGQSIRTWQFSVQRARQLLQQGWTLIFTGFVVSLYLKVDQIILGQLVNSNAVGIYSVAVRFSEISCFLPAAIISSLTPSIMAAREESQDEFYRKLEKLFNIMALLGYAFALILSLFAKKVIDLVYGESYIASSNVMLFHAWSIIFVFLGSAKYIWVVSENQGTYALISGIFGALLNIVLNFWLIPSYQAVGAAIATLISYAFTDYLTCFFYPPARRIGQLMSQSLTLRFWILNIIK
jgi:PST family polysaccharide transporter